jgi:hypothetical protein
MPLKAGARPILIAVLAAIGLFGCFVWRNHDLKRQLQVYQQQGALTSGPELSQVVTDIKEQIATEQKQTAKSNLADTWQIHDIDLELSFTIKQEQTSEGHAETKLIAVTDTRNISAERVQRVTFHLLPVPQDFQKPGIPGTSTPPPPKGKD